MPFLMRISAVCLALLLFGCAGQSARREDAALIDEAQGRIRSGDFEGAARVFQHLSETSSAPDYYRLMAADAELRGGNGAAAQALLGQVRADDLVEDEQYRYTLLKSRLYLNQGRAREAMAMLDTLSPQQLDPGQSAHYHTLRASAYNQLGNMLESARERVFLGYLLKSPQAVEKNNEAIYEDLSRMPEAALSGLNNGRRDTLGGWIELAALMKGPGAERPRALAAWREQYPQHPANGAFLNSLEGETEETVKITPLPSSDPTVMPSVEATPAPAVDAPPAGPVIGVMLPLSGSFAPAGQAIRGGIEAAHAADASPNKPSLKFLDTQGGDVSTLYRQLVDEGAQDVVGPLMKEDVARLAAGGELSVPVLALNQGGGGARDNLFQFGLTPEQEVEQSAGSAWFDGRQNALVLAPASAYGQRLISHFSSYWKSLGGKIVAIKTYKPGGQDFTSTVHDLLASSPGALAAEEGGNPAAAGSGSADFVFLIGDARDARLLRPQLETQQAAPLPVYALSQVFSGRPDAVDQDQDLAGVIFCDLPWMLNPTDSGPLSRASLQSLVERTPESYTRLIPLGIDAYNLVAQLPLLKSGSQSRYAGATGQLVVEAGNRIQRQLSCAQFESGVPQPRGIAPMLKPSATGMSAAP